MKVCFFIDNITNTGGTERVTLLIANELVKHKFEIIILSLWGSGKPNFEIDLDIRLESLNENKSKFKYKVPATIWSIRKFIQVNEVHVFVSVESILSFFSVPACSFLKIRHIVWEHFNFKIDLGLRVRRFARFLAAKYADVVVVLTHRDLELWAEGLTCKAALIPICNPLPYQIQDDSHSTSRTVLAVGRLTYQKGFDLLIQAWKIVSATHQDWQLKIVGSGPDLYALQQLIEDLHLNEKVNLYPSTNAIKDYYKEAALFCLSSRFEGLPMVLLEAQAFRLPTVCFDCETGPSEVIIDGYNGYLCQAEDVTALSNALDKLISNSALRDLMSMNAGKNAERFSLTEITKQWVEMFEKIQR